MHTSKSQSFPVSIMILVLVAVSSTVVPAAGAQPGPDHEPKTLIRPGTVAQSASPTLPRACLHSPDLSRQETAELEARLTALLSELEIGMGLSPELRSFLLELQARAEALLGELRAMLTPGDWPCPDGEEPDNEALQPSILADRISRLEQELRAVLSGTPARLLSGTGAISGTVTETATGQPLSGVTVRVYDENGEYLLFDLSDTSGSYTTPAELDAGIYYLKASRDNFMSELYDGIFWRPSISENEGTPVVVEDGSTTAGIDFSLEPGGFISGTVSEDPAGTPVAGADVRIYDGDSFFTKATSDGSGSFVSPTILPSGSYYLWTLHLDYVNELYDDIPCRSSYACHPSSGASIAVIAGTGTTGIDVALVPGCTISGTVIADGSGDPISACYVNVRDANGVWAYSDDVDSLGSWQVTGLPAGTYYSYTNNWAGFQNEVWEDIPCSGYCSTAQVINGTPIPAAVAGTGITGIDFVLANGASISGTVTDATSGARLSNIRINVYNESGSRVDSADTDADGVYLTDLGLAAGTYFVLAQDYASGHGYFSQLYDGIPCVLDCDVTSGTPIEVGAGAQASGIDLALQLGGRISGTVSDAGTAEPIDDILMLFYDEWGDYLHYWYTDESGSFSSRYGLPTGTYFFRTSNADQYGYLDELYDDLPCPSSCTPTSGTPISVTAGSVTVADLALDSGRSILGQVTDSTTGVPIEGITVIIFDSNGSYVAMAETGATGSYKSDDPLAPGTYYARASSDQGGSYVSELYGGTVCFPSCDVTTGTPITVEQSVDTTGIDFVLTKGGSVSGTVTDADTGEPLDLLSVYLWDSSGLLLCDFFTEDDGSYTSSVGLPAGEYRVTVRDRTTGQRYLAELYDDLPYTLDTDVLTGTPIMVSEGTDTPGIDFALQRGGTISGTIHDSYSPAGSMLIDVDVYVYDASGYVMTWASVSPGGTYTLFDGLPTGTYYVVAVSTFEHRYFDQLYDGLPCEGGCDVLTGDPVSVTLGLDTPDIDFALDRAGSISGTVRLADSGDPAGSTRVSLLDGSGAVLASNWVDRHGEYAIGLLHPGSYYLQTETNLTTYIDELYDGVPCVGGCSQHLDSATAITITAAGEIETYVDMSLYPSHSLSGTVSDRATGAPLDAVVELYDAGGALVASELSSYTFEVASGVYFVKARHPGYRTTLYDDIPCPDDSCHVTTGTPIVVGEDDITGIDLDLDRYATISGTVMDQGSNRPISVAEAGSGAEVWLFDAAGTFVTHAELDGSGSYSFSSVEPGTYFVRTYSWQGWVDELYDDYPCPLGSGCDVTTGTPITCDFGTDITGIDFVLSTIPDGTPPLNPTLSSSSHEPGVWSTDSLLVIEWSGASDASSRIIGYSVVLDTSPLTEPDEVVDIVQGVDPHGFASGLSEGEAYTFHLRTCDSWGNCSDAVHLGPFLVDQTPPGPVGVISSSHTPGEPSCDRSIELWWQAANDGESGVAGYGAVLDDQPDSGCPGTITTATQDLNVIGLVDGSWYLHVCAVDNAGHWGPVSTAGPYVIASEELFSDGFESGDLMRWSASTPAHPLMAPQGTRP